jgi:DNA-binding IclR family transcriptional regulator
MDCSSPGHLYLASLAERERKKCIEALMHEPLSPESPLRALDSFAAHLARVRQRGFAIHHMEKEAAVSVPIFINDRMVAAIGMHFIWRVLSDQVIETEFVPILKASAQKIQNRLIEAKYKFSDK